VDADLELLRQARERRLEQAAKLRAEQDELDRLRAAATAAAEADAARAEPAADPGEAVGKRIQELVDTLRGFYHPKQRGFFRSPAKQRATKKTRRSGATAGGCRELIARAVEHPRFRAVYITDTRVNARARCWRNDTQSGLVDVIERYGTRLEQRGVPKFDLGGVTVEVRDADLELRFSNGSKIELFGADDEGKIMDLRGLAKHVYWVDEAQDFRWLERLYRAVIMAGMSDFGAECWLTGTPSRDLVGMFYEVTRDDESERSKGWEVHELTVTDNPFFGRVVWEGGRWYVEDNLYDQPGTERSTHAWSAAEITEGAHRWGPFATEADADTAAIAVRWERAAASAIRKNGLDDDDPDVLREWKARWVKEGARYVYELHKVPEHEIVYAPVRLAADGFPDLRAAMLDLPERRGGREYFLALGADLGTRAAFAFVIWAWSLKDPILYELASWKRSGLDYDEMAGHLHAVRAQVGISLWAADAGGGGKPAVMGWSKRWVDRYHLPIIEATKQNKRIAQNQLNTDIRKGLLKLRKDSVLMVEWKAHRWKPLRTEDGREVEDGTPHDASDGGLYAHRESFHHRYRPEEPKIVPGSPEAVIRDERELESAICEPQDEQGDPYSGYGAYR